ncbi:uncharacterized protein LOC126750994 [Bactrocera neohumeralis]|uniref:uncharacterized protein LOC126750994 n=1 Tax=Bactrocera neohumeralis TaxID=98809 RepID=UPI002165782A|nr:uncharacterized protein LOC126750994 [Bactrocera neohumeralis]
MSVKSWHLLLYCALVALPQIRCAIFAYDVDRNTSTNNFNEVIERPTGWLQAAQDMIASPAGHVVTQVAKELINRSTGNSQVLSLNLTNLLIIILLKILIFAAGMLGAGHWSGYGYGYGHARSAEDIHFGLSDGEDYLITGFLAAQGIGLDDCLYAAACASPNVAYEYAKAAKALIEGIEKYEGNAFNNPRYNDLIVLLEKAAYDGYRGLPCNRSSKCDNIN